MSNLKLSIQHQDSLPKGFILTWKITRLFAVALVTTVVLLGQASCCKRHDHQWWKQIVEQIEYRLGFTLSSPYFRINGKVKEHNFVIENCPKGGVLYSAGARSGDVIIRAPEFGNYCFPTDGLYVWLEENQGKRVNLTLTNGGDGPPIESRPRRIITFEIPKWDKK